MIKIMLFKFLCNNEKLCFSQTVFRTIISLTTTSPNLFPSKISSKLFRMEVITIAYGYMHI